MSALEAEEVGQSFSPHFAHGGTFGTKNPQVKCVCVDIDSNLVTHPCMRFVQFTLQCLLEIPRVDNKITTTDASSLSHLLDIY